MTPSPILKRVERHDPGPPDQWQEALRGLVERRRVVLARDPTPADGRSLLECDLGRAALGSLFPDAEGTVAEAVARGSGAAAAAALCQGAPDGWVLLAEPGGDVREIPTGPAGLSPARWRDGLALALVARDRDALSILCDPRRVRALQQPADRADPFWTDFCLALAAAVAEPGAAPAHARAALQGMARARIAAPEVLAGIDRPQLELAQLLAEGAGERWDAAVARALELHRDFFSAEERRWDRDGFLAVGLLGLCALAHDRGIPTRVDSPYLPAELVRGERRVDRSMVTLRLPARALTRSDEAGWALDLAGFPRQHRTHRVVQVEGRLVARYEAHGAAGLPHLRADFLPPGDDAPDVAPAVDAGELLRLAELLASRAGDEARSASERRTLLAEAAECADAALARVPPGAEAVPAASLTSGIGAALLAAEPGRLRAERLRAYRDSLSAQAARPDGEPAGSEPEARGAALASIELLRAQVAPILRAVATDRSGEAARMLRPRDEDFARVFVGEAVEEARRVYAAVWDGPLDLAPPHAEQTELRVWMAPAGMLADENELSREFPGGYRAIARWLNPRRVWVRWKYVQPGRTSGMAYDGLVWCDDHWAWFPKPFRALRELSG